MLLTDHRSSVSPLPDFKGTAYSASVPYLVCIMSDPFVHGHVLKPNVVKINACVCVRDKCTLYAITSLHSPNIFTRLAEGVGWTFLPNNQISLDYLVLDAKGHVGYACCASRQNR